MPPATAIADRFPWLPLHINAGNGTSLKNKIGGGFAYSKRRELLTELGILHRVIVIKRVSNGNTSHPFRRLKAAPPAWPQPVGKIPAGWEREAGRGEGAQGYASLSTTHLSW